MDKVKNSMPSFTRGTLEQLQRAIIEGKVTPPNFHFLTEPNKKCLAFVDIDNQIYQINLDRIEAIEKQLEGLKDPETGEAISVTDYVAPTIESVEEIKENGATILVTSDVVDGGDE